MTRQEEIVHALKVREQHQAKLLQLKGVIGVSAIYSRKLNAVCLLVYVEPDAPLESIPEEIEGFTVDIQYRDIAAL